MYKPVVLIVLDGWGIGKSEKGNAIAKANLPTIDKLNKFYPYLTLQASGISVGLPWGEVGNSEVGHITLGTGRIIYQNMPRITMEIQSGSFFKNQALLKGIENAKKNNSKLHLMGLLGKGTIHSYFEHIIALLELAKENGIKEIYVHAFTDGRDSSPDSGAESISELQKKMDILDVGKIASVCGRYFAMDRNNNWDRTKKAYDLLTKGEGEKISDPVKYLKESYSKNIFDEYIEPAIVEKDGKPLALIEENDSVIFFNFREDRARQITKAFVLPGFMKFEKKDLKIEFVAMIQYEEGLPMDIAFFPIKITETLGSVISKNGLEQMRIAETEKFAHVTYFFNGGAEEAYPKEERVIIQSVVTDRFDKVPEMKAQEITETVISNLEKEKYSFILINYANADIIAHTGNEEATIKAVEEIDKCLEKLIPAVLLKNGCLLITADHGNAEELKNSMTGETDTEHSINPVPFWFVTPQNHKEKASTNWREENMEAKGLLSDIAPTILEILELEKPKEMTGESLLPLLN